MALIDKTPLAPMLQRNNPQPQPNAVDAQQKKNDLAMARAECAQRGGKWDELTQSCIFNLNQQLGQQGQSSANVAPPTPKFTQTKPEVIPDEKGNITGVKLPDGTSFLGLDPKTINAILSKYNQIPSEVTRQGLLPIGGGEAQFQEQQQVLQTQQEQQGLFNTEQPTSRELSPEDTRIGADIPVLGAFASAMDAAFGVQLRNSLGIRKGVDKNLDYNLSPQELRNVALTQIEENVYKEGIKADTKFGTLIESIPIVGKYAGKLATTPSGDVSDIRSTIGNEVNRANNIRMSAQKGEISPEMAFERIEAIEQNIQRMESKIRLLINYSPILRANPEEVDKIEADILTARQRLLRYKAASIAGTKAPADDYSILKALEENGQ
jgi:hypothetical protein